MIEIYQKSNLLRIGGCVCDIVAMKERDWTSLEEGWEEKWGEKNNKLILNHLIGTADKAAKNRDQFGIELKGNWMTFLKAVKKRYAQTAKAAGNKYAEANTLESDHKVHTHSLSLFPWFPLWSPLSLSVACADFVSQRAEALFHSLFLSLGRSLSLFHILSRSVHEK